MPENTITTPLGNPNEDELVETDSLETMVKVDHVSMVFNMASEQLNSLKEYAIALAKRELMFKEFRALDNVSFEVKKGDVFGILGTNGSGKSTMLKIIAGVLEPSSGSCTVNGNIAPLIELGAGFDLELTARENIYLNGALLGYSRKFIEQHFDEIVSFAEIEKFLDMPMKNYSSGMVARIAFAIATVVIPEVLIVDEVLSVGDFMFQQKCEHRIMSLIKDHGVTVLIVSHNNDQIERLCNKAIWIEKGHTRMLGSAADVCRTYRILGGHVGSPQSEKRVFEMLSNQTPVPDGTYHSIAGDDKFSTSVKLMNKAEFPQGSPLVLFPGDSIAASAICTSLAGAMNASLLPTKQGTLPDVALLHIRELKPKQIILATLGGEPSSEIRRQLEAAAPYCTIEHIAAQDEYDLSQKTLDYGLDNNLFDGRHIAVIRLGANGDLVGTSPFLYSYALPIILAKKDRGIDERVLSFTPNTPGSAVYTFNLTKDENSAIAARLDANSSIVRFDYNGPYNTNCGLNNWITSETSPVQHFDLDEIAVASVWDPFDALTLGVYAGRKGILCLLEDPQDLDSVSNAIEFLQAHKGSIHHLSFIGNDLLYSEQDKKLLAKTIAGE